MKSQSCQAGVNVPLVASRRIIDLLVAEGIGTLVIGEDVNWWASSVNASFNIIQKAIPNAFADEIEDIAIVSCAPAALAAAETAWEAIKGCKSTHLPNPSG